MNNLTKIAALPGSGAGCMSALPAEKNDRPIDPNFGNPSRLPLFVQMRAPYFDEPDELVFPPIDLGEIGGNGA